MRIIKKTIISTISLIAFLFFAPLEMIHNLWCKFVLRQNITVTSSFIKEAYAVVLSTVEEALKTLLPNAQETKEEIKILTDQQKKDIEKKAKIKFDPKLDKEFHFFIGTSNGQIVGYAVKDTVKGKWGPIHYMLSLDPNGKIMDAMVLQYKEKRGRPVAKRRFLDQFVGKTVNDKIKLKKDIRGVSGATISSRGMTNGIRKLVYVFEELYKK
jgi:Na+-translocating ferredoxin:NAD+ oxidoreductase RnfG subunit